MRNYYVNILSVGIMVWIKKKKKKKNFIKKKKKKKKTIFFLSFFFFFLFYASYIEPKKTVKRIIPRIAFQMLKFQEK